MTSSEIKTELRQFIDDETDFSVLEAFHALWLKTGRNSVLKEKLTMRALKSEEDIQNGRVFDKDEVIRKVSSK